MGETLQIAPGEEGLLSRNGLTELEDVFRLDSGVRLDKAGLERWRQRWRLVLVDEKGEQRTRYLKRFERPPLGRQWQRWREGHAWLSTAGVEWTNARLLAEAGVAAVEAVAFGQDMLGWWERRSFVLTRAVEGDALERWVPGHLPPVSRETDLAGRRVLLGNLARLVGGLHRAGFVHRDLYLSHVFIAGRELRLIDLQRVFRPRWRRRRWVVKDLAALHFSTPADRVGRWERLRFLCRYVAASARILDRRGCWLGGLRPSAGG